MTSDADPTNIEQFAKQIGPIAEDAYMTAAEKLTKQGEEKGRQQGLEEGLKEGQATLLLRLLALRFGAVPAELERRVRTGTDTDVALWAERVLTAGGLDEVFRT
ncbi:MAG TPA: DUF4351 domain-containing protein [Polyangiaceae bacterium]|nr:DUF4351 domain-containing protein [Polyangiaceae bacterium]